MCYLITQSHFPVSEIFRDSRTIQPIWGPRRQTLPGRAELRRPALATRLAFFFFVPVFQASLALVDPRWGAIRSLFKVALVRAVAHAQPLAKQNEFFVYERLVFFLLLTLKFIAFLVIVFSVFFGLDLDDLLQNFLFNSLLFFAPIFLFLASDWLCKPTTYKLSSL